jgi:acetophenone carboxylase
LKVPPLKVGENFKIKTDVLTTIVNNVRDERMIANDMRARSAACMKIRERVLEMAAEKGAGFVVGMLRKVVTAAAEGARSRIAELNDGVFRHTVFFDTRGYHEGLGRIAIALIKQGDAITIDLTGTSPQTQSYLNTRPHIVRAILIGDLCQYLFCDLPASSGLIEPFTVIAPEGSCVNPSLDAAISGSVRMTPMVVQGIHMCINKMIFDSPYRDRVAVPFGTGSRNIAHGGRNQFNKIVTGLIPASMNGAGGGARPDMDGEDGAGFWFSGFGDTLDVEHEELRTPFLYAFRNIPRDQGGFGKHRGGAGVANCLVIHNAAEPYSMVSLVVTAKFPVDMGLFGGYAAGLCAVVELKDAHWQQLFAENAMAVPVTYHELAEQQTVAGNYELNSMIRGSPFRHGESVAMIASSAGGYGDVLERSPELVRQDLRFGFVSPGVAENIYRVVVHPGTLDIDLAATEAARAAERADRKRRGMSFAQFEEQWLTRRPSAEIIQYFGPWPEAAPLDNRASV